MTFLDASDQISSKIPWKIGKKCTQWFHREFEFYQWEFGNIRRLWMRSLRTRQHSYHLSTLSTPTAAGNEETSNRLSRHFVMNGGGSRQPPRNRFHDALISFRTPGSPRWWNDDSVECLWGLSFAPCTSWIASREAQVWNVYGSRRVNRFPRFLVRNPRSLLRGSGLARNSTAAGYLPIWFHTLSDLLTLRLSGVNVYIR